MRRTLFIILLLACSLAIKSYAQGTIQVTFDGPPVQPPGTDYNATNYSESGMSFTPIPGSDGFSRVGPATTGFADNGTVHLAAALGDSLMFLSINGSLSKLLSVDLAEYSTAFQQPITVQFTGYYADGSTVTTSFTTDGIIDGTGPQHDFQTFLFPNKEWSGLKRVEVPGWGWSLDNLVVSVPEPASWALALCSAVVFGLARLRRRR